ncbi:MAG TPA: coenzyme F420-0:L-glutamate ligase [Marmoricola sp.]|nr:coenzyme F420-0:L-glutamate ligase [Marmoricola sp.]
MTLELEAPDGVGEIVSGTDLVAEITGVLDLSDGDIVVITSKVISKSEGRLLPFDSPIDRDAAIDAETVREVARRGPVRIVENRLGLVMAAAGVDASNIAAGTLALLPLDPDATARSLREEFTARLDVNVAVLIADTAGRAWRIGQTDIAIGLAGLDPYENFEGRVDSYGNELAVTAPAIADEIAGAAELASSKLGARPFIRVRGLKDRVLPRGEHGPGARALQRSPAEDLFNLGSRDAVIAAMAVTQPWSPTASPKEVESALVRCGLRTEQQDDRIRVTGDDQELWRAGVIARVHGWVPGATSGEFVKP